MTLLEYNQKQIKRINRWWLILRCFGIKKNKVALIWIKLRAVNFHNKNCMEVDHG